MSDYTPTGKPQTLSPQVSKQMRDEFQSIADAVNSKSEVDGDTYTGVHDFTGATLEVPTQLTSDNSNKAASTAFVKQVAINSSLPDQAGHATKTLITDGTNASWGRDVTKANKAGDTYTGTHNFTGAAVTVPTVAAATSSTTAASTAFVHQVVQDSALPNQAGHATKTLITDGVTASWGHDVTKANKAGDTYTGTHNFTVATVTVPTAAVTTSSGAAASTAFVRGQPNWDVIDVNDATSSIASNRRGEIYVCGPAVTDLDLPNPTSRFYVRAHNPNPGAVTINAGGSRTINGGASISLPSGGTVTITRDGSTDNYRAFFFNVGGGGGGLPYDTYQDFLTSGTFTVQKTGWHRVTIVGAGGSGGSYQTTSSNTNQAAVAAGGGAGGIATAELVLTQGTNYTVTIGAGGASVTATNNGNAGGTTLVVGPGLSMVANGGGGGESAGSNSDPVSATGGAGGTASTSVAGATYTGGSGGNASAGGSGGQANRAAGGGSPNILALASPPNGGPASRNRSATTSRTGGGASVGGSGGFSDGNTVSAAGPVHPAIPADTRPASLPLDDWRLGYPVRGNTPVIGDGRGLGSEGTGQILDPTPAQAFGGGGGITSSLPNAPSGGLGAGGGGRAIVAAAGIGSPSGAGGNGLVLFEWIS